MKKILIPLLFFTALTNIVRAQKTDNQFELKGKLAGQSSGLIYLYYSNTENKRIKDSCAIVNDEFFFKGNIDKPTVGYLQLKEVTRNESNSTNFFMEPVQMSVNLKLYEFRDAKFTGSKIQKEYEALAQSKKPVEAKYKKQLDSLRTEKDHEKNAEIRERLAPYFSEMDQKDYIFFDKHRQSYVTAYMMRFHASDLTIDSLQLFYDRLGEKLQQSADGKNIAEEILKLKAGSPGSVAKDFSATDINGVKLSLSDLKGKYVLLDFWASWCVPCRKGNPHLKELYVKYKGKGMEVVGISDDDRNPDAWRKAVEKDGLPWRHVLRGLDMQKRTNGLPNETEISDRFGIHTLPTRILIDPKGMIIGRYGEEEEGLTDQLKKIFGE